MKNLTKKFNNNFSTAKRSRFDQGKQHFEMINSVKSGEAFQPRLKAEEFQLDREFYANGDSTSQG